MRQFIWRPQDANTSNAMTAPLPPCYNWSCHKCQAENAAGTGCCAACGFPAFAQGRSILNARAADTDAKTDAASPPNPPQDDWLLNGSNTFMFFPEAIPAVLILGYSPFWFFSLLSNGSFLSACILALGGAIAVAIGHEGYREKSKWLVYIAMMGILLTAGATSAATHCK